MKKHLRTRTVWIGVVLTGFLSRAALADGWHNAALATASLDQWLSDVKAVIPQIEKELSRAELRTAKSIEDIKKLGERGKQANSNPSTPRGGVLQANLTAEQQALLSRKAGDCLEILAYMDVGNQNNNIIPAEFPSFQLHKIPEYRKAAKQMLKLMGSSGASSITGKLREELMGMGRVARDVSVTRDFEKDLLELFKGLAESGQLSMQDADAIAAAASGAKLTPQQAALAKQVMDLLENNVNLATLLRWEKEATDAKRKSQIATRVHKRVAKAGAEELVEALSNSDVTAPTKKVIGDKLVDQLPKSDLVDLFRILDKSPESKLQQAVARELAKRSPEYREVKDRLGELVDYLGSQNTAIDSAAQEQLANAFGRAPIPDCLDWLGRDNIQLNSLIWKQVDARIARADPKRKASYVEVAVNVLANSDAGIGMRGAALEFLGRLKERQSVGPVVDQLTRLPRELWPKAGQTLESITGKAFGPKKGDGAAEVSVSVKKWRDWSKTNGGEP